MYEQKGYIYIGHKPTDGRIELSLTTEDHKPNYLFMKTWHSHPITTLIKEMYDKGCIKFADHKCKMIIDFYQFCYFSRDLMHLILGHTAVLQGKRDILSYSQSDKLSVRILQNRSHMSGKLKNTAFCGIHPIDDQFAGGFARIGTGIQSVNTARQSTFPATGGTCDQNSLTRIDIQIDIC